ncbi:MAG TPA: tetratricopeptide repeat protein [Lacunisphaera sp.]
MFGNLQSADDDRRTEIPFRLKKARSVRLFALVFGMGVSTLVAGYYLGRPVFSKWRFQRDLRKAIQYEEDGDSRSAMLMLEQLNRLYPTNADMRRRLAGFYERMGQGESVAIWQEAVALDPTNSEGRLGLARAAIHFGDRATARKALEGVSGEEAHIAEYHRLRAGLAFLERDVPGQEANLAALEKLDPADQRVRLNLAALRISDPRGAQAAAARAVLLDLARGSQVRIRAVMELLNDVARRWPAPSPERDAALKELADTLTPPRGPLLELPSRVDQIDRLIAYAMTQPAPTPEDAVSLANWMSLNGQTGAAMQWLDSLPEVAARTPVVKSALAELAIRAKDWVRLQNLLVSGAWGAMPAAAVEQAFRAHAGSGPTNRAVTPGSWSAALEAAKSFPAALRMLLRLSEIWEWPAEHRQVLQTIARNLPRESWAWRQFISQSLVRGETDQVWQIYQEWRRALPGDSTVQIEAAIMGFLLERRPVPTLEETTGYTRREPAQAGAAVAHALALWRAGRAGEAAGVLDALPAQSFAEPRYALAYGIVLAEVNRSRESGAMLDRVSGGPLLPEERDLVRKARERNQAVAPNASAR